MRVEIALALGLCIVSAADAEIAAGMFRHRFIAQATPGRNVGMGSLALADFDKDGDLNFAFLNRGDGRLYWYEQQSADDWVRRPVGEAGLVQPGSVTMDVDSDGWMDIVIGGYWYRNTGAPRTQPFVRYEYDGTIMREIHDMVAADVDGGGIDVVPKIWNAWNDNANGGKVHADWLENLAK